MGGIDPLLLGPRVEHYWVELLDREDNPIGVLDGVIGGRVEYNEDARIKGGCQLTLAELGQGVDWMQSRFRPWVEVNGLRWPLGVFLPASPKERHTSEGVVWDVSGLDKLSVLDEVVIEETFAIAPGAWQVGGVRNFILDAGETNMAITENTLSTDRQMVWEAGTSYLSICNDLLDTINYQRLWVDGYGQFQIRPFIPTEQRGVRAVFEEGEWAIHSAEFSRDQDIVGVPNKVILLVDGDDENPGMVGIATNEVEGNPYSYQARGRWVTRVYENVEAADQATLDSLASRYLWNASTPVANYSVSHAVVPLDLNDLVRFTSGGRDAYVLVNEWGVDLAVGSLMSGLWREVSW